MHIFNSRLDRSGAPPASRAAEPVPAPRTRSPKAKTGCRMPGRPFSVSPAETRGSTARARIGQTMQTHVELVARMSPSALDTSLLHPVCCRSTRVHPLEFVAVRCQVFSSTWPDAHTNTGAIYFAFADREPHQRSSTSLPTGQVQAGHEKAPETDKTSSKRQESLTSLETSREYEEQNLATTGVNMQGAAELTRRNAGRCAGYP